eukprot:9230233-Lingulodinium_polyedra.AAC.1
MRSGRAGDLPAARRYAGLKARKKWLRIATDIFQEGHCIVTGQTPAINAINVRGIVLECGQAAE